LPIAHALRLPGLTFLCSPFPWTHRSATQLCRLLRAGADPSKRISGGDTPRQKAVHKGKAACVAVFDRRGITE